MKEKRYQGVGVAWWLILLALLWASYARAQQCTQQQLHDEFYQDVSQRGYVSCASDGNLAGSQVNDTCVQGKLNAPCTDNANCGKVDNILSSTDFMQTIVDSGELETLANSTNPNDAGKKAQLGWFLAIPSYNMAKASWQQKWKNVFKQGAGGSPLTNAAINAAQLKDAPRCQTVCNKGSGCTLNDVALGLRGQ